MNSDSTFANPESINIWIRNTCLTIDSLHQNDFLENVTYLSSYLLLQLKTENYTTPTRKEIGFIFIIRDIAGHIDCINNILPIDALNHVVISLPKTKEFIPLNNIELDSPYTYNRLRNISFFPSGIIHVLPPVAVINTPHITLKWSRLWSLITAKTCPAARKIFCKSFAAISGRPEAPDHECLRLLLDPLPLNKAAIANILNSSVIYDGSDADLAKDWELLPNPFHLYQIATPIMTGGKAIKPAALKILPGRASLNYIWKGNRSLAKRNYHVDPRHESKRPMGRSPSPSAKFDTSDSAFRLTKLEAKQNIDDIPSGVTDTIPRRLSSKERNAVASTLFRRLPNIEYWNPNFLVSIINNSLLWRIWVGAFKMISTRLNSELMKRGNELLNTIELISLIDLSAEHSPMPVEARKNIDSHHLTADQDTLSDWLKTFKQTVDCALSKTRTHNIQLIANLLDQGASASLVIYNKEKISSLIPCYRAPISLGSVSTLANPSAQVPSTLSWTFQNLTQRNTTIWNLNNYSVDQLTDPNGAIPTPPLFESTPATETTCFHLQPNCPTLFLSWFNTDSADHKLFCDALCHKPSCPPQ
ncbi:unnamed protein product [Oikopleura dioica]|uniref:Uncharacterized protein n=1 Tax=Oikopleura dioica TaxID=34765 RepID=E4YBW8_OIKDI|nr:unnamed protein product [Oikopleura dioica]